MLLAATEDTIGECFFIGAICINQDDIAEHQSQVSLMGSVYERAHEVTVWFGLENSWVLPLIRRFSGVRDRAVLRSCLLREPLCHLSAQSALEVGEALFVGLHEYVYWTGLWVAQEYLLPTRVLLRAVVLGIEDGMFFDAVKHIIASEPSVRAVMSDHLPSRWLLAITTGELSSSVQFFHLCD